MTEQCFLCAKKSDVDGRTAFAQIGTLQVPASQKPLTFVLQHLANCVKMKLIFHANACLCAQCYKELCNYDNLMLNLLKCQRKLTRQLQQLVIGKSNSDSSNDIVHEAEVQQSASETQHSESYAEEFIDVDDNVVVMEEDDSMNVVEEVSCEDSSSDSDSPSRSRFIQECIICGMVCRSKVELNNHVTEVHSVKSYICKICGVARRDEEYLELHMNLHEGKTENECRYCPKRFSRPVNTIRHMRKHWDKKKYQCEKCGECFSQDNLLYNHRLRHEAEENPLICSVCNQSFKSRKTFTHHMTIHQENRKRHQCTLCSKSFTERYTLKVHMKTHGMSEVPPETDFKEVEDSVKTIVEQTGHAENDEDFNCVICRSKFDTKEQLDHHLQFTHDVILK